jgi:hypothetical protein
MISVPGSTVLLTHPTGVATVPPVVLGGARFTVPHFDGGGHQHFVMDTTALAARPSAHPRLIHLDMLVGEAADTVLIGAHHGGAELVENAERRLVA